jgi:hypothetical protein
MHPVYRDGRIERRYPCLPPRRPHATMPRPSLSASIAMRRQLNPGLTRKAQVLPTFGIGTYFEPALGDSGSLGTLNVHLQVTQQSVVTFEFKLRFACTTFERPLFGQDEAQICVRHFVIEVLSRDLTKAEPPFPGR